MQELPRRQQDTTRNPEQARDPPSCLRMLRDDGQDRGRPLPRDGRHAWFPLRAVQQVNLLPRRHYG